MRAHSLAHLKFFCPIRLAATAAQILFRSRQVVNLTKQFEHIYFFIMISLLSITVTRYLVTVIVNTARRQKMTLREIEKKIEEIKRELSSIKRMRAGSLSQRYNVCGVKNCKCKASVATWLRWPLDFGGKDPKNPQKHGPYVQLSFVHQRKK